MPRHALAACLLLAATAVAQEPAPPPSGQAPEFPAQVEQVIVDVVVTDKKGNPIRDLTAGDFTVLEDGKPQTIASFDAIQVPPQPSTTPPPKPAVSTNLSPAERNARTFVVVFDNVHMTKFNAQRAKVAIAEFLRNATREGDRVSLVATSGDAWWSARMEAGRDELIALLKRLEGRYIPDTGSDRMSDWEAMRINIFNDPQVTARVTRRFDNLGVTHPTAARSDTLDSSMIGDPYVQARASEVYFQSVSRNRITLETMERILEALRSTRGRKSLILVSDGFIYDTNLSEFRDVIQASRRANTTIYYVEAGGLEGMPTFATAEFGRAYDDQDYGAALLENVFSSEGSQSLAADSGGFSVRNTNDLTAGIQRIAGELEAYYMLGYNPTNATADGKFRKIEVKVARKGVEVRARKGYYAPGGDQHAKKPTGVDPDIQRALDSPYNEDEIPLRMTAYVMDENLLGKANTIVVTDVDIRGFTFKEEDGRFKDAVEFLLVAAHRESGEYFRFDQAIEMNLRPETRDQYFKTWLSIPREFDLAPGGYQAKIVVRERNTGRIGTVVHEFDVPRLDDLRVSTVRLSDTLVQDPGEGGAPHLVTLARRTFHPDTVLYGQFSVYGAAKDDKTGMPRVSAAYEIRGPDGDVRFHTPPSEIMPTSLGKLVRLVGTRLEHCDPGRYEFVLNVKDEISGKSLEIKEPFTVEEAAPGPPPPA
jgi:VWFA-related protein